MNGLVFALPEGIGSTIRMPGLNDSAMRIPTAGEPYVSFVMHTYDAYSGDYLGRETSAHVPSESADQNKNTTPLPTIQGETNMQLYEYAVIYLPQNDDGTLNKAGVKILTAPSVKLSKNERTVENEAIREVTDDGTLNFEFVQVQVRPFGRY